MSKINAPYNCVYTLNNELLLKTSEIAFQVGRFSVLSAHHSDEENMAKETKALLSFDGISLTPSQFRALGEGGLSMLPQAEGLFALVKAMPKINPFDMGFMDQFEKAYFPLGAPRRCGRKAEDFAYIVPLKAKIEPMLQAIYRFQNSSQERIHPLCLSGLFYFQMQAIQPYSHSDIVLSLYLMKAILVHYCKDLMDLPLFQVMLSKRADLDHAYEESVACGDTSPFLYESLLCVETALNQALKKSLRSVQSKTPLLEKLLSKMEDGRFYSAQELCDLLGLKSRLGLQKNYIRPGLDNKYLVMLNPLTPTDRNQKYKKA